MISLFDKIGAKSVILNGVTFTVLVASTAGTSGQVLVNGGTSAASGAVTLSLSSGLTSINSVTSAAGQNLVFAAGTGGTAITIANSTRIVTIAATTDSTSTSSGALVVAGGVGIGGYVFVASQVHAAGFHATAAASNGGYSNIGYDTTNGLHFKGYNTNEGGSSNAGRVTLLTTDNNNNYVALYAAGGASPVIVIAGTTASTSTTTGVLTLGGGLGVAGAGYFGGGLVSVGLTSTVANAISVTARSGASGSYTGISVGRTADEAYFGIAANTNDWTQGAVAGDAVIQTSGTTRKLHFDTNAGSTTASITIAAANGPVTVNNTTAATSNTTGGLVVSGGIGCAKNIYGNNFVITPTTLTYGATTDIDGSLAGIRSLSLTGNVTFTTSNLVAGRSVTIKILCDGTGRTFTFPSWIWLNSAPASIAANKTAILVLTPYSTTDGSVVASYAVQA